MLFSIVTISRTIRPNDWHRPFLLLSPLFLSFSFFLRAVRYGIPGEAPAATAAARNARPARWTRNRAASHGRSRSRRLLSSPAGTRAPILFLVERAFHISARGSPDPRDVEATVESSLLLTGSRLPRISPPPRRVIARHVSSVPLPLPLSWVRGGALEVDLSSALGIARLTARDPPENYPTKRERNAIG